MQLQVQNKSKATCSYLYPREGLKEVVTCKSRLFGVLVVNAQLLRQLLAAVTRSNGRAGLLLDLVLVGAVDAPDGDLGGLLLAVAVDVVEDLLAGVGLRVLLDLAPEVGAVLGIGPLLADVLVVGAPDLAVLPVIVHEVLPGAPGDGRGEDALRRLVVEGGDEQVVLAGQGVVLLLDPVEGLAGLGVQGFNVVHGADLLVGDPDGGGGAGTTGLVHLPLVLAGLHVLRDPGLEPRAAEARPRRPAAKAMAVEKRILFLFLFSV
ncbi:hypothetical protein PG995_011804 [Apiospora arundinis]